MTQDNCEHEPLVAAATRSGSCPPDLEHHVAACASCAETKRVAQLFLEHAATTSAQSRPPAANIVWQKMQAHRQQQALIRATRCMMLLRDPRSPLRRRSRAYGTCPSSGKGSRRNSPQRSARSLAEWFSQVLSLPQ